MMKNALSRRSHLLRMRQSRKIVPQHEEETETSNNNIDATTTPLAPVVLVATCGSEKKSTNVIRSRARSLRQSIARSVPFKNFRSKNLRESSNNNNNNNNNNKPRKVVRFDTSRNVELEQTHRDVPERDLWYSQAELNSLDTKEACCFDGSYTVVNQRVNKFTMALSRIYGDCCQSCSDAVPKLVQELSRLYLELPSSDHCWFLGLETQLIPGFVMQNQERRDQILFEMQRRCSDTSTRRRPRELLSGINTAPELFAQVLAQAQALVNDRQSSSTN